MTDEQSGDLMAGIAVTLCITSAVLLAIMLAVADEPLVRLADALGLLLAFRLLRAIYDEANATRDNGED